MARKDLNAGRPRSQWEFGMIRKVLAIGLLVISGVAVAVIGGQMVQDWRERPADYFSEPMTLELAEAIMANDRSRVDGLIASGADVNARGANNLTLLQWQVMRNDLGRTRWLLDLGADPDLIGLWGETAVHLAAAKQSTAMLELLLDRGANPNAVGDRMGRTPLFTAMDNRSPAHIELLIERGADIEHADTSGGRPLLAAARINLSDYVVRLLELGADPEAIDDLGVTFQPSFFRPDPGILSSTSLRNRQWVIDFLESRDIAIDPGASRDGRL